MPIRCKISGLFTALTLALAGLSGCIREDLSDCRPGILLAYDYSLNTSGTNLFGSEVDKVTVYAFDANGYYVASYSDAGSHLTNDYLHRIPLPEGEYTLVVWAGPLEDYLVGEMTDTEVGDIEPPVADRTHIDDFMLKLRTDKFGALEIDQTLCPLWHGTVSKAVSDYTGRNKYTAALTKNTHSVVVRLRENSASESRSTAVASDAQADGLRYMVELQSNNGRYTAKNSLCENALGLRYSPLGIAVQEPETRYDFSTLRLMADRSCGSRLVLVDTRTGKELLNSGLVDLIFDNPGFASQNYLDRTEVFNIDLGVDAPIDGHSVKVTIKINGWEVIEVIPEV